MLRESRESHATLANSCCKSCLPLLLQYNIKIGYRLTLFGKLLQSELSFTTKVIVNVQGLLNINIVAVAAARIAPPPQKMSDKMSVN